MNEQLDGQMNIFDFIPELKPVDEWALPCDTCGYDVKGCCDYDYHQGDFCRLGDKWKPKEEPEIKDDYIRENPTCFYVFGHYLDREAGWHKVPDQLPTFTEWTVIDVVVFGKKTSTAWMEHGKWEAKDWTFRSVDQRRDTETTEILAWKKSEDKTWNEQ